MVQLAYKAKVGLSNPTLPTVRRMTELLNTANQYSKAEQKAIIEHGLYHRITVERLAKHFNVSLTTVYRWKNDYLMGMYADEVIYNHTIAFRRGAWFTDDTSKVVHLWYGLACLL